MPRFGCACAVRLRRRARATRSRSSSSTVRICSPATSRRSKRLAAALARARHRRARALCRQPEGPRRRGLRGRAAARVAAVGRAERHRLLRPPDDAGSPLDAADAPVLQLILAGAAREAWQASTRGLSQTDLAMQVVLPELRRPAARPPRSPSRAEADADRRPGIRPHRASPGRGRHRAGRRPCRWLGTAGRNATRRAAHRRRAVGLSGRCRRRPDRPRRRASTVSPASRQSRRCCATLATMSPTGRTCRALAAAPARAVPRPGGLPRPVRRRCRRPCGNESSPPGASRQTIPPCRRRPSRCPCGRAATSSSPCSPTVARGGTARPATTIRTCRRAMPIVAFYLWLRARAHPRAGASRRAWHAGMAARQGGRACPRKLLSGGAAAAACR